MATSDYYAEKLSADRLRRVYEVATPRVKQYMAAEIQYLLSRIKGYESVMELGCGYGRVLADLCRQIPRVIGIDTSLPSLESAKAYLSRYKNFSLIQMNALHLGLLDKCIDCVAAIQNGVSAFHVEPVELIRESLRVTRSGGLVLFSTYSDKFWEHRLEWFEIQSKHGLLGEIDYSRTRNGHIVCKDGFTARTPTREDFRKWTSQLRVEATLTEIDESSLFCEMRV